MPTKTVTINGTVYDRHTGLPVSHDRSHEAHKPHLAQHVHAAPQKSRTLSRRHLAKEHSRSAHISTHHKTRTPAPAAATHHQFSRFAKEAGPKPQNPARIISDMAPAPHATVRKVHERMAPAKPVQRVHRTASEIKQSSISSALENAQSNRNEKAPKQPMSRFARLTGIAGASLAILVVGGYVTYINMPSLSTRVASAQAGIDASYPNYKPNGYQLSGPVSYTKGAVSMHFAANAGPQNFTLSQEKSDWDSSAVLDNFVQEKVGDNYTTTTANGLTIYSYDKSAAWVNDGILYTIDGDAPLSSEQIQRIATSL